jgi:hypothetical protein
MVNKENFLQYIKDFNKGDYRQFILSYFTEDAIFENPELRYEGRENIIHYFIKSHKGVNEVLRVKNILIDGNRIAAELEAELQVTADRPDHHIRPVKNGDTLLLTISAFYDLKDSKICHVRIYRKKLTLL